MRGIPWRLLAAGTLTAVLLDLPFPLAGPLPVWRTVFAWFALVPLLVGLLGLPLYAPGHRRRWYLGWSFLAGWLCGAFWFGANCYWVYGTMHTYAGLNEPLAVLSLVLFSLYLGSWFGVFALALTVIRSAAESRGLRWVALAAVPFLWTAMEFALARVPEFPWDQLGYSQVDNGLLTRLAPWAGVYGISFVLAGVNALLAAGLVLEQGRKGFSMRLCCGVLGVSLTVTGAAGFLVKTARPAAEATAVLVQPNLDVAADDVWVGPEWDRRMAQFAQLAGQTCSLGSIAGLPETGVAPMDVPCSPVSPTLIAWPESPAPFRAMDPLFQAAMRDIALAVKAPMIVGDVGVDLAQSQVGDPEYRVYNSASVVATDGRLVGRYDKMHLVPFGEYIPAQKLFFFLHKVTANLPDTDAGTERKVFRLNGRRYGVFICYESVFGDEVRQFVRLGAEVLVNISDDGWYGDTSAPWQHLNMARMRAIENRRWILRDTNNGTTAAIDPYGTVRQSIPRHAVGALAAKYGYNSEITFYTVHGDWLPALCAILALALVVWAGRTLLWNSSPERSVAQQTRS
jgi:apolipoprotein N-acyltransferase